MDPNKLIVLDGVTVTDTRHEPGMTYMELTVRPHGERFLEKHVYAEGHILEMKVESHHNPLRNHARFLLRIAVDDPAKDERRWNLECDLTGELAQRVFDLYHRSRLVSIQGRVFPAGLPTSRAVISVYRIKAME